MADAVPEDAFAKGEQTNKIQRVVHEELSEPMDRLKKMHKTVLVFIAIAALGFTAAMFLNRYATAEDLSSLATKAEKTDETLRNHITAETSKLSVLESQGKRVEEDFHWQREQTQRIADRVGARRVPPPPHATISEDR